MFLIPTPTNDVIYYDPPPTLILFSAVVVVQRFEILLQHVRVFGGNVDCSALLISVLLGGQIGFEL